MKKWFVVVVSVLLVLLLVSNIYLLVQMGRLNRAINSEEPTASSNYDAVGDLAGTWKRSGFYEGQYLLINPDGTFFRVQRVSLDDGTDYIANCYKGYIDGNTLIYEGVYNYSAYTQPGVPSNENKYSDVNDLSFFDFSSFSTITRYGNDAIQENWGVMGVFDYTRQK